MKKNLSMEVNAWWDSLDLVNKILVKDAVNCFCSGREEDKENYVNVIAERLS